MKLLPIRLSPDVDLRTALEAAIQDHGVDSAFVLSGIGSLVDARIRFANEAAETIISGPLELVSIAGTLTSSGSHLHVAVSDRNGVVTGGHLSYGSLVRTTAEILVAPLADWTLSREHDDQTGFKELVIRTR